MSETQLTLREVAFSYGQAWDLKIPKLRLGRDRVTCIVGPNGSGKSTLMRIAAGILPPATGSVLLGDEALAMMDRRRIARQVGFLPQESPALFDYSVEEVVRMGRYCHLRGMGFLSEADTRAVGRALQDVELTPLRSRPLSHLSGGERRRALIASVLAQAPDILLLDEPTSALDIHHAAALMRLLAGFDAQGPSVIIVTHDINLAALFSERLILLVNGSVRADGPPATVVTPAIMADAYGEDVLVREHPETGDPMMVPRRHTGAGDAQKAAWGAAR